MKKTGNQQEISGPIMNAKDVESMVRPVAPGTVPHRDQGADEEVEGDESNRDQADVGGEIQGRQKAMPCTS